MLIENNLKIKVLYKYMDLQNGVAHKSNLFPDYRFSRKECYCLSKKKVVKPTKLGNVLIFDKDGLRRARKLGVMICECFYPDFNARTTKPKYDEVKGYHPDALSRDKKLLQRLIDFDVMSYIKVQKSYTGSLYYRFYSPIEDDAEALGLCINGSMKQPERTLFYAHKSSESEMIGVYDGSKDNQYNNLDDMKQFNSRVFYFCAANGKVPHDQDEKFENEELLEHIVKSKYNYILYKIEELEFDVSSEKRQELRNKFIIDFDVEETFDNLLTETKTIDKPAGRISKKILTNEELQMEKAEEERIMRKREEAIQRQVKRQYEREQKNKDIYQKTMEEHKKTIEINERTNAANLRQICKEYGFTGVYNWYDFIKAHDARNKNKNESKKLQEKKESKIQLELKKLEQLKKEILELQSAKN